MSDQNSASAVPPEQPGQPPQLPPPVAPAPVAQAQAPAQPAAPVVVQHQPSNMALWVIAALLTILVAFMAFKQFMGPINTNNVTVSGLGSGGSTTVPPSPPTGGSAANDGDSGFIKAGMCVLMSDGTSRLVSAQLDLEQAKKTIGKNPASKEAKALLAKLEEATKSLPPDTVIASLPKSKLPKGTTCADWRAERGYDLVIGAPEPQKKS